MNHITKSQLLCVIASFTAELAKLVEENREGCVRAEDLKRELRHLQRIVDLL